MRMFCLMDIELRNLDFDDLDRIVAVNGGAAWKSDRKLWTSYLSDQREGRRRYSSRLRTNSQSVTAHLYGTQVMDSFAPPVAMQTAAQNAGPALVSGTSDPFSSIEQSIRGTSEGNDPAALRDAAIASVRAAITGDPKQASEAKDRAAQAIAKAEKISVEEARTRVDQHEKQYRQTVDQAKQRAAEAADTTARAVSRGALFGSLALLLGALAG
jgi:hypothetical protein